MDDDIDWLCLEKVMEGVEVTNIATIKGESMCRGRLLLQQLEVVLFDGRIIKVVQIIKTRDAMPIGT
jgi:hypothetical protein